MATIVYGPMPFLYRLNKIPNRFPRFMTEQKSPVVHVFALHEHTSVVAQVRAEYLVHVEVSVLLSPLTRDDWPPAVQGGETVCETCGAPPPLKQETTHLTLEP